MVVATTLVSCGGSDSDEDTSPPSTAPSAEARPASEEFVRQLDALCKDANPELAEINTALTRGPRRSARRSRKLGEHVQNLRDAAAQGERDHGATRGPAAQQSSRRQPSEPSTTTSVDSLEQGSSNLRQQVGAAEARDAAKLRDLSVNGSVINAKQKGRIEGHGGFRFCGQG